MAELTVGAVVARALMDVAVAKGANRAELAERSRIDLAELADPDHRISFTNYITLMRAGKELSHDPALALHFGESFDINEISVGCLVSGFAQTITEGFALMNRYAPLTIEVEGGGDRFVISRIPGHAWIIDTRKNPNAFPELTESTFARMACSSRRFHGDKPFLQAVYVTHAEPAYRSEYDRIFQVPVVFDSDTNAFLTDDWWVDEKLTLSSPPVLRILSAHAEALLENLVSSKSTRSQVEGLLMPILHTGKATIDTIADKLKLSRQTLFRRLKAEGVTFEQVLDELRHRLALHYLSGKKVSVNETAYLVGFSEPAAFSRAFKRWTGSSPRTVRRNVSV